MNPIGVSCVDIVVRTLATLVLAACSQPAPRLAPPPRPPADAAVAAVAVDADLPPEPQSTDHAEVTGPDGIRIAVSWLTMTGTMHTAADLTITTPHGALHFSGDDFGGDTHPDALHDESLPLVDRILAAGAHRWVVLGWSSGGEGMQAEHAWLVDDAADGPRIVDTLVWLTDRAHGGVALEASARGVVVGIPLPGPATQLHNPTWWQLRHGDDQLSFAMVTKLPARAMPVTAFYTPPDDAPPATRHWTGRFAMFETKDKGFVLRR